MCLYTLQSNNYCFMIDNPREGRLSRKRRKLKTHSQIKVCEYSPSSFWRASYLILRLQRLVIQLLLTMAINVNRGVLDPFYRYKMPRLVAKVEGKGNGIKTVIANMSEIAKALERPPTYPTKYFGCELGAQTNIDMKNERFIVNGEHDANKLQDILDGFIKKFVLCTACENPETIITVRKNQIHSRCKACGNASIIDPKHKLSTFILKNPPKSEEKEREKKENAGGTPEDSVADEMASDRENASASDGVDDNDWAEPVVEEVVSAEMGKLIISKDLEKAVDERLDMLHQFFVKAKASGNLQDSKRLLNEAERLELKSKATLLLADVLFDDNVVSQVKQHRTLLLRFTLDDHKAQRHLLGGVEQLIARNVNALLPKTAHIIKALYDSDIVEEEILLAWEEKPTKKYVKKKLCEDIINRAKPVLDWLRTAESEDESDEEGGGNAFVQFDDRVRQVGAVNDSNSSQVLTFSKIQTASGEEVNIDDI